MLTVVLVNSSSGISGYVSLTASSDEELPCEQIIGVRASLYIVEVMIIEPMFCVQINLERIT